MGGQSVPDIGTVLLLFFGLCVCVCVCVIVRVVVCEEFHVHNRVHLENFLIKFSSCCCHFTVVVFCTCIHLCK